MGNMRRRQVEQNRKKRWLIFITLGILLFIYLSFTLVVGENGLYRYIKLRSTRDKLLTETITIEKQNKDIKSQIESLENEPDHVEGLAREYGLTKPDELIFKFENKQ